MAQAFELFEEAFARWARVRNVVGCASGTAALHLALEALGLPPGSEVIVPTFTMIACARAVTLAGLTPVFVDCKEDLNLNPNLVSRALEENLRGPVSTVRALLAVHVYGRRCNMNFFCGDPCCPPKYRLDNNLDVGSEKWLHDLRVVEDLAEAHGVAPHPRTDAACWSFYRNKIVAGEEGGAVAFAGRDAAARARSLRSLGFTEAHDFTHIPRGHNYRLSNVHAALLLKSLRAWGRNVHGPGGRKEIESWYDAACPPEWRMPPRDVCWVYDLRVPGMTAEQQGRAVRALQEAGIEARHAFKPMHLQEEYRHCRRVGGEVAERAAREVIYLPAKPGAVTEGTARLAFDVLGRVLKEGALGWR